MKMNEKMFTDRKKIQKKFKLKILTIDELNIEKEKRLNNDRND